jgi:GNAT superfamily N-acetyltransferase
MGPADLSAADRLRELSGWNQTPDDWQRLLAWGPGLCIVAERDGRVVATTTATPLGSRLAWIGMVLVDPEMRRQGIARLLLAEALSRLEARLPDAAAGLDATPLGQPLYESAGFRPVASLTRVQGTAPTLTWPAGVRLLRPADRPRLAGLDREAFKADRGPVMNGLLAAAGAVCMVAERGGAVEGFACARPGAHGWYIGPVVAADRDVCRSLIVALVSGLAGQPVVLDHFDADADAADVCRDLGLQPIRPFIRMVRGPFDLRPDPSYRAIAGPEVG